MDINSLIKDPIRTSDTEEVEEVLRSRDVLAVGEQLGGSNTRVALATVPHDLAKPKVGDIQVDTFVLEGKDFDEGDEWRHDISLLQKIIALAGDKLHSITKHLAQIIGIAGAPVSNESFMARNQAQELVEKQVQPKFYLPNIRVHRSDSNQEAKVWNLFDFVGPVLGEFKPKYKFENDHGSQLNDWLIPDGQQAAEGDKTSSIKVVNDGIAHVLSQASKLKAGESIFHLVMSTGTNAGIGFDKKQSGVTSFAELINPEAGHNQFADLVGSHHESPLTLRSSAYQVENQTFESILAGGNDDSPWQGPAALVRSLIAEPDLRSRFADLANSGSYSRAVHSVVDAEFNRLDIDESSLMKLSPESDINKAIGEAAIAGDKFSQVLLAIWADDLARVVNQLAANAKTEIGARAEQAKFHFSMNGTVAYSWLDNPDLGFIQDHFRSELDPRHFVYESDGRWAEMLVSKPKAEMDGLAEQTLELAQNAIDSSR